MPQRDNACGFLFSLLARVHVTMRAKLPLSSFMVFYRRIVKWGPSDFCFCLARFLTLQLRKPPNVSRYQRPVNVKLASTRPHRPGWLSTQGSQGPKYRTKLLRNLILRASDPSPTCSPKKTRNWTRK